MPKHHKPTSEELEAAIKKADAEIDAIDNPKEPEAPPVNPEPSVKPETPPVEPKKPVEAPKEKELTQEEIDYKKKFIASTREAQILSAKNKKVMEAFEKAEAIADPTDDDMTKEYPDWEDMGEFEKKIAKSNLVSTRRFSAISEIAKGFKDLEAWQNKVDEFIGDPQSLVNYPELEGKQEEFKFFATKPTRSGVEFETLVSAFAHDFEKAKPIVKKAAMFEMGSGGPNDKPKPKSDKLTLAEASALRDRDYKKWKEYLLAGKIEEEEI